MTREKDERDGAANARGAAGPGVRAVAAEGPAEDSGEEITIDLDVDDAPEAPTDTPVLALPGGAAPVDARDGDARLPDEDAGPAVEVLELADEELVPLDEPGAAEVVAAPEEAPAREGASEPVAPSPPPAIVLTLDEAMKSLRTERAAERGAAFARELLLERDGARRAVLLHEQAALLVDQGDSAGAAEAERCALDEEPGFVPAAWALRADAERASRWHDALDAIDLELRGELRADARAELLVERGHLLADRLGDPEAARGAWEAAVAARPGCLGALMALERRALQADDRPERARLLRLLADGTIEPSRRVELLLELADLIEEIGGSDAQAYALLEEAWAVGASRERVLDACERLAERHLPSPRLAPAARERLVLALERRVALLEQAGDAQPAAIVAERRRQASLLRDVDRERARRVLEMALVASPDEPLLVDDLIELAEEDERFGEVADLLSRRARSRAGGPAMRASFARARALRKAGRASEAAEAEAALSRDAELAVALVVERERGALDAGDLPGLADAFLAEAAIARTAGDTRWLTFALRAAAEARNRCGDEAAAIDAWREVLAASPGDPAALERLDGLLARAGRHEERAALLRARVDAAGTDRAQAERALEALVELRAGDLGDVEGALSACEALCAWRGGADVAAIAWKVEIARAADRDALAAKEMARLAVAFDQAGATTLSTSTHLACADLLEHRASDTAGALAAIDEILARDPGHEEARASRRRLLVGAGRLGDVAADLERALASTTDPREAARLLAETAVVAEARRRPDEAAIAWQALVERAPDEPIARRLRVERAESAADEAALAVALLADVPDETVEARGLRLLRVAELHEGHVGQPAIAAAAYMRAAGSGAEAAPHAALGLYRALLRTGEEAALDGSLAAMAAQLPDGEARLLAGLSMERAALAAERGDGPAWAEHVEAASSLDPALPSLHRARVRAAAGRRAPDELAESLAACAADTADPRLRVTTAARAALLAVAAGGDAGALLERVLEAPIDERERIAADAVAEALTDDPRVLARCLRAASGVERAGLVADRVEALLARGRLADAADAVALGLRADPSDVVLLEAARRIAWRGGDRLGAARSLAALGASLPGERGASLLVEAARSLEMLGEPAEAAVAWRTLLDDHGATHGDVAYERAHDLLIHAGDAGALEELLDRGIARAEGPALAARLVERGALRMDTARPDAAAEDLREALALVPDHPIALRRHGDLVHDRGDEAGAIDAYERLIALEDGDAHALLLRVAELHERRGDGDLAVHALRRAIAIDGADPRARERLAQRLEASGDAVGAVEQLVARASLDAGPEAARFELRAAVLLRGPLGDARGARAALARALVADPMHQDALRELTALCDAVGDTVMRDAAILSASRAAMHAIAATPDRPEPYRVLERVGALRGDDDGRQLAAQAAAVIAGRTPPPRRDPLDPTRPVPPELWAQFMGAPSVAIEVWRAAAAAVPGVFGPDLESLGATRATRQADKGPRPAWAPIDRLARALDVGPFALYAVAAPDVCVIAHDALIVGTAYAAPISPAARYRVARKLVLLRDRLAPLETAAEAELELFFAACAQAAGVRWEGRTRPDPARAEEWARRVNKALDRQARKELVALAPRCGLLPEIGAFRRDLLEGAARLALAVAGDLAGALADLSLAPGDVEAQALARLAVSEPLAAVRRAIGARV